MSHEKGVWHAKKARQRQAHGRAKVRKAVRRAKRKQKRQRRAKRTSRQQLNRALNRFIDPQMFADLREHGNTHWKLGLLLRTALLWTISEKRTWRRRFAEVAKAGADPAEEAGALTFEGFRKALCRAGDLLRTRLSTALQAAMMAVPARFRRIAGREVFAVDGTSLELPRTLANQRYFCGADVDLAAAAASGWHLTPQMHLTTLWHVGLAVPWQWRTGPGDTSERHDLREMIDSLPKGALVVADAGFVGFDLWGKLLSAGVDLVMRVGNNVHLIEGLQTTTRDDLVSYWPHEARRAGSPPQLVRLVRAPLGSTTAYLLTNVLDPAQLSDAQVVEIYRARWGVELFYRGLKQTFARRRLLGRTPAAALVELDLSMLALWMLHLLGLQEQLAQAPQRTTLPQRSTVKLLDAFRDAIAQPDQRPWSDEDLPIRLAEALLDTYQRTRSKKSRRYPRQHTPKPCEPPVIRQPKHEEQTKLRSLIRNGLYKPIAI